MYIVRFVIHENQSVRFLKYQIHNAAEHGVGVVVLGLIRKLQIADPYQEFSLPPHMLCLADPFIQGGCKECPNPVQIQGIRLPSGQMPILRQALPLRIRILCGGSKICVLQERMQGGTLFRPGEGGFLRHESGTAQCQIYRILILGQGGNAGLGWDAHEPVVIHCCKLHPQGGDHGRIRFWVCSRRRRILFRGIAAVLRMQDLHGHSRLQGTEWHLACFP